EDRDARESLHRRRLHRMMEHAQTQKMATLARDGADDDRRTGPNGRDDDPEHPGVPDPRPAPSPDPGGPGRPLRRGPSGPAQADRAPPGPGVLPRRDRP